MTPPRTKAAADFLNKETTYRVNNISADFPNMVGGCWSCRVFGDLGTPQYKTHAEIESLAERMGWERE